MDVHGIHAPWIEYLRETFGERNRVEGWLSKLRGGTVEDLQQHKLEDCQKHIATAIALTHNIHPETDRGCNTWLTVPLSA
ncbi:MAG: hypothetical protein QXQ48_09490 [Nitrososphaerota archaeon]